MWLKNDRPIAQIAENSGKLPLAVLWGQHYPWCVSHFRKKGFFRTLQRTYHLGIEKTAEFIAEIYRKETEK